MHGTKPKRTSALWKTTYRRFGKLWFSIAAVGQIGFIGFIVSYYGPRTMSGNYAGWNDKALIKGHVAGDDAGNLMFITHVLLAAVMTFGGLAQLVPSVRNKYRAFHRWNGRIFIGLACFLASGGLWLGWGRVTRLSIESGLAVSLNGIMILAFAVPTVLFAMRRDIARHQKWAMRVFMLANGVWFLRVAIMGWIMVNQAPRGMNSQMNGPADLALTFGSFLVPWIGLELYYAAQKSSSPLVKGSTLALLLGLTVFMAIGIAGTMLIMWPNDLRSG